MKTVFFGTPEFSVSVLSALIESEHDVCAVVSQPDKAKNRGKKLMPTPVKEKAVEHGITVLQPEKVRGNDEFLAELASYEPDIIVVVAYGQILPKEVLELPKYGCINVHASLLPHLRGAAPIQRSILEGDKETGVTIMQMAEGLDTGDMLIKEALPIGKMNYSELHDALAALGAKLIVKALCGIEKGEIVPEAQDDSLATYAHMIFKQDGKIDFSKPAEEIERLIRGLDPWPGAFCDYGDVTMKFWKADVCGSEDCGEKALPGTVLSADKNGIKIACGAGELLVTEIQVPGKKRTLVSEYLKGNKIEVGTLLK